MLFALPFPAFAEAAFACACMQRADEFACMRPHPDGDPAFPRGRRGTSAYPLCASLTFPRQKFALLPTFEPTLPRCATRSQNYHTEKTLYGFTPPT